MRSNLPMSETALTVENLTHRYGERVALDGVSFEVRTGEIFGLLGPNGGGKTTLFRVLSTLIRAQEGGAHILGADLTREAAAVRQRLGVVFQAPSLDKKLRVGENMQHQGALYGMRGAPLANRIAGLLEDFKLTDRVKEEVEALSGGLQRRVEIAKALLHAPKFLLLDEPSTGLDPGARIDLWNILERLRHRDGVTILLTTHLMEEAERCDRIAILDRGKIVAIDSPDVLRAAIGSDIISVMADEPETFAEEIARTLGVSARLLDGKIRIEQSEGHQFIPRLMVAFPDRVKEVTLGRPTLEDVFISRTGRTLAGE